MDGLRHARATGGFNVYPSEVEQVISALDPVLDVAVIGTPDEKWGEAVTAVIALKTGKSIDADTVIQICKSKLGSVKSPKIVEFRDGLPKSPNGKVLKSELRKEFWRGRDHGLVQRKLKMSSMSDTPTAERPFTAWASASNANRDQDRQDGGGAVQGILLSDPEGLTFGPHVEGVKVIARDGAEKLGLRFRRPRPRISIPKHARPTMPYHEPGATRSAEP